MNDRPIRLQVADDLRRGHGSVLFRFWFTLPFLLWLVVWSIAAFFVAVTNWLVTVVQGSSPDELHGFLARYVRYATHVYAYLYLAAERMPAFDGKPGYAIDVQIDGPRTQSRWTVAFRLVLAMPALLIVGALVGSSLFFGRSGNSLNDFSLIATAAFLAWFVGVARGRIPRGLRDLVAYGLCYAAQVWAYLLLLTDRYPDSNPQTALADLPVRSDPIGVRAGGGLRRSRLTVFFRLPLTFPHLVWLILWTVPAYLATIVSWLVTLIGGTPAQPLHRFLSAYLRYQSQVYAYLFLIAGPFPGFVGAAERYPLEVTIAAARRQNRWKVLFRLVLIVPALLLATAYGGLLLLVAILGWFAALATGRLSLGLRNTGALAIRYIAQTGGYFLVLTDAYPYSGPTAEAPEPTDALAVAPELPSAPA